MRQRWAIALLGMLACRPPPHNDPPGAPDRAAQTARPATGQPKAPAPIPAFIAYTDDETHVIPLDPSREPVSMPGYFVGATVGDDARAYGLIYGEVEWANLAEGTTADVMRLPLCPSRDTGDSCGEIEPHGSLAISVRMTIGAQPTAAPATYDGAEPCGCVTVTDVSTDGDESIEAYLDEPGFQEALEVSPYDAREFVERCWNRADEYEAEFGASAVTGGVLYETGMAHNGVCGGLNIYDGAQRTTRLRPDATIPDAPRTEDLPCFGEGDSETLYVMRYDPQDAECRAGEDDCDCWAEMSAFAVQSGELVYGAGGINTVGIGCYCSTASEVTPASCPSPLDPCGRPDAFPGLTEAETWFVANDGSAALTWTEDGLGIRLPGDEEARRRYPLSPPLLGVEFHPDTALLEIDALPDQFQLWAGRLDPADVGAKRSAKQWGNRCFVHFKAGRLDAAEAACVQGLLAGGNDGTRGALTYNLGRIAEARGRVDRAGDYYHRSLQLRPGHQAVERRLTELSR